MPPNSIVYQILSTYEISKTLGTVDIEMAIGFEDKDSQHANQTVQKRRVE